jgi:hypothetical protein
MRTILIPFSRPAALGPKIEALRRHRADAWSGGPARTAPAPRAPIAEAGAHERLQKFRESRDRIGARLDAWLVEMRKHRHSASLAARGNVFDS